MTTPGKLHPGILEQDERWIDKSGTVLVLAELHTSHLARLEPFLRRHGERLRWAWSRHITTEHFATALECIGELDGRPIYSGRRVPLWSDNGGNLDAGFEDWVDSELDRPLEDWLAARPLIIRIRQLLEERNAHV